jgi:hypothetical protein
MVSNKQRMGRSRRNKRAAKAEDAVGKYASDAWSLAKRTALGLNEIRKLINVEHKFTEITGSTTFSNTGAVVYVSGCSQGDTVAQRDGSSIKVQTLRFNYFLKHNANVTGGVPCRILVVRDMQNSGATITANDVLETVGISQAPLAFRDYTNGPLQNKRFAMVYDNHHVLHPYKPMVMETFVSNSDVHVYYRGTDATVNSAGNGSYFVIAVGADSGANLPEIFYSFRLEFTDN